MRDIVIISSWHRADYLRTCLDALLNARGIQDKQVWIFQNTREAPGLDLVHDVLNEYNTRFDHIVTFLKDWPSAMLSHCDAWQRAYAAEAPKAYFIVDDAVVTPDFFDWHEAVQADGDWFGSSAWRATMGNTKPFDVAAYYQIDFPNEIAVGLCLKRDSIRIALQSAPDWYPIPRMIEEKWKVAMPYVPRVYHIGSHSSQLDSAGENNGPAIDVLPNPIPDYGRQTVVLK